MAWNFAGAIGSSLLGAFSANASSRQGYKYQSRLQSQAAKLNYKYALKSAENLPTSTRAGLENAGYNPMLAVQNGTSGANAGWTTTGQASAPDYSQAVSNALEYKRLQNETQQSDSVVRLQNEQAQTEQSKRENYEFQNAMLDVEKHLKEKDLSAYDERFYNEMYRMMQESEKLRAEAGVVGYNAESQRIIANATQQNADTNREWTPAKIGAGVVTGLGVGALGMFGRGAKVAKGAKALKGSKHVQKVVKSLHTFGKTKAH